MRSISWKSLPVLALALSITACNDDGNRRRDGASNLLQVSPSLGMVRQARVNVYQGDGVTLIGSGTTAADGSVSVEYGNYTGPVVIEVLGGNGAIYFDEAAKSTLNFPAGERIRAMAIAPENAVAVTPLTNLAYEIALARGISPLTEAEINAINEEVRAAIAPGISSILSVPSLVSADTASNSLDDTEAGRYALLLAALAEMSSGAAAPAIATLKALVADGKDSELDGIADGASITVPYSDFVADLNAAISAQAASLANSGLQGNTAAMAPESAAIGEEADGGENGGGTGGETGGGSGGETGGGTGGETGGGSGGETGGGTGGETGGGTGGETGGGTGGETGGGSGEETGGGPGGETGGEVDPEEGNQGKGRFTGDGFTGDIDGVSYTFTDVADVLRSNNGNGMVYLEGLDSETREKWRIHIPDAVGSYQCDDIGHDTVLQYINADNIEQSGLASNNGSCAIKLVQAGPVYEGYFSGTFSGEAPQRVVTNGYFHATLEEIGGETGGGSGGETGGGGVAGDLENAVYDSLNGNNGAYLKFADSDYRYLMNFASVFRTLGGVRQLQFSVDNSKDVDTSTYEGLLPAFMLLYLPHTLGEQTCNDELQIVLSMNSTVGPTDRRGEYSASNCTVRVDYASELGGMQGVILSASLEKGDYKIDLENVPFKVYDHVGLPGSLTGDLPMEYFGSIELADNPSFELGSNQYFLLDNPVGVGGVSPDDGTPPFTGNASDIISLQVGTQPTGGFAGDTTYNCGTEYRSRFGAMQMSVKVGTYLQELRYTSAETDGECEIVTVSRGGKYYDATYTATLFAQEGLLEGDDARLEISGSFRNYAVALTRPEVEGGDEGALAPNEAGITMRVDEGSGHWQTGDRFKFLYDPFEQILQFDTAYSQYGRRTLDRSKRIDLNVINMPRAIGVYDCADVNSADNRAVQVSLQAIGALYQTTLYSRDVQAELTLEGAACQVEILSDEGGFVTGTYTATALIVDGEQIMPGGDNVVTISGEFRRRLEIQEAQ